MSIKERVFRPLKGVNKIRQEVMRFVPVGDCFTAKPAA